MLMMRCNNLLVLRHMMSDHCWNMYPPDKQSDQMKFVILKVKRILKCGFVTISIVVGFYYSKVSIKKDHSCLSRDVF